jgi:hypothetical protein
MEIVERAKRLSRTDVTRLDLAERQQPDLLLAAWDVLRSQLDEEPVRSQRYAARNQAWAAVNESLEALGIEQASDDGYWRVTTRVGWGAARAARFVACASIDSLRVDPDVAEILGRPWHSVFPAESSHRSEDPNSSGQ